MAEKLTKDVLAFEVGCRVQPFGGGFVVGELIEFNADATGALVHWDNGHEAWKALRNLDVIAPALNPEPSHDE